MSDLVLNKNLRKIQPSASILLMDKARQMKAEGADIISLAGGEPDYDTPFAAARAGIHGIEEGRTHYTVGRGIAPLRKRIEKKLAEENGVLCREVLVTPGCKYGIFVALMAILNLGDEVMVLDPSWVSYHAMVRLAGGTPVGVPLSYKDGYRITKRQLEQYISGRTRILLLNTPNNPTGRVMDEEEAKDITDFVRKHGLILIADEIYEKIIFDGRRHISLGSDPGIAERVITVNGLSKCAAMTGWRVGYLAGSKELIDAAYMVYQHTMTCISEFSQLAALEALEHPETFAEMRDDYQARRDLWFDAMREIPSVSMLPAEGTFYAWMKIDKNGMDSGQVCDYLLREAKVVMVPGIAYNEAECCVRASLATGTADLKRAAAAVKKALNGAC